jgi:hypothetical protein
VCKGEAFLSPAKGVGLGLTIPHSLKKKKKENKIESRNNRTIFTTTATLRRPFDVEVKAALLFI